MEAEGCRSHLSTRSGTGALELGWHQERVAIVDEDLARSGSSSDGRLGFTDLVAEVGRVGLILGSEVSRLARNNADWYQLLDLCTLTGTLVADGDGSTVRGTSTTVCCSGSRAPWRKPNCT